MTNSNERLACLVLGFILFVVCVKGCLSTPMVPLAELRYAQRKANADIATAELHGHGTGWNDRKGADLKVVQGAYSTAEKENDRRLRKRLVDVREAMEKMQ